MKSYILFFILLTACSPLNAQNDNPSGSDDVEVEYNVFKQPVNLSVEDQPLGYAFSILKRQLATKYTPSFIFKNETSEIPVSIDVTNATLDNLFLVLEQLTDCRITVIDSDKNDDNPGIVFVETKTPQMTRQNSESLLRLPASDPLANSNRSQATEQYLPSKNTPTSRESGFGGFDVFNLTKHAPSHLDRFAAEEASLTPVSRTYSLHGFEKITPSEVIDAIRTLWKSSDPEWVASEGEQAFSMHEPTQLLIIRAPQKQQAQAKEIITELGSSFNNEDQINLQEAEYRMQIRMRSYEDANLRLKDELAIMMRKLQEREIELVQLKARLKAKD